MLLAMGHGRLPQQLYAEQIMVMPATEALVEREGGLSAHRPGPGREFGADAWTSTLEHDWLSDDDLRHLREMLAAFDADPFQTRVLVPRVHDAHGVDRHPFDSSRLRWKPC